MIILLLLTLMMLPLTAWAQSPHHFCAILSQANTVPPTGDPAMGLVQIRVNYGEDHTVDTLDLSTHLSGAISVTQGHLHCAPRGANGPVVAYFGGRHDGGINVDQGTWVNVNLDDSSVSSTGTGLTNPITCKDANGNPAAVVSTIDDLVQQASLGNIYACVHDRANPGGAIRGQLTTNCGGR